MSDTWNVPLEFLADNKFVLGDRLVEVGVSAPELQSALAAVALAQGELGHARHLYHWVQQANGASVEVTTETGKSLQEFRSVENWIELMAAVLIVNAAAKVVFEEMRKADPQIVVQKTAKMSLEMEEHLVFSGEWGRRFAGEMGAIPRLYNEAVTRMSDAMETWLQQNLSGLTNATEMTKRFREEWTKRCNPPMKAAAI